MAKIILSRDAQVLQEVELSNGRITIGRHKHNHIVLDHRAVSGEHAAITSGPDGVLLEDLGSTNGTFVNGERIARHQLADRDRLLVATFQIDYLVAAPGVLPLGAIEVINGAHAGKKLELTKPVTTLGTPGELVVAISRHASGYFVSRTGGSAAASVNGAPIGSEPHLLRDGDRLELTGTGILFTQPGS